MVRNIRGDMSSETPSANGKPSDTAPDEDHSEPPSDSLKNPLTNDDKVVIRSLFKKEIETDSTNHAQNQSKDEKRFASSLPITNKSRVKLKLVHKQFYSFIEHKVKTK